MPYWLIFSVCHSRRTVGFAAPNPIPLTEIECALRLYRVPEEMHQEYTEIIVALDNKWRDHWQKTKASSSDNGPTAKVVTQ